MEVIPILQDPTEILAPSGAAAPSPQLRRTSPAPSFSQWTLRRADRRIAIEVTQAGKDWLALTGFDPVYGARPLKRLIQTSIEDPLARQVLSGQVLEGDTVRFDVGDAGLSLVSA